MNKRLAEQISLKTKESYGDVIRHIRTKLRFALLKSLVIAVRGYRGRTLVEAEENLEDISFNLIPHVND